MQHTDTQNHTHIIATRGHPNPTYSIATHGHTPNHTHDKATQNHTHTISTHCYAQIRPIST